MLKIMIMIFSFFITPAFANTPLGKAKNYYLDQGFNKLTIEELKKISDDFDGLVTNKKNIILGILTADCAPILFFDPIDMVVGACHAGWRGALTGIIENTLIKMRNIGSKTKNIRCAIGPCIGQQSYEVGKDFYNKFVSVENATHQFFEKNTKNQF